MSSSVEFKGTTSEGRNLLPIATLNFLGESLSVLITH